MDGLSLGPLEQGDISTKSARPVGIGRIPDPRRACCHSDRFAYVGESVGHNPAQEKYYRIIVRGNRGDDSLSQCDDHEEWTGSYSRAPALRRRAAKLPHQGDASQNHGKLYGARKEDGGAYARRFQHAASRINQFVRYFTRRVRIRTERSASSTMIRNTTDRCGSRTALGNQRPYGWPRFMAETTRLRTATCVRDTFMWGSCRRTRRRVRFLRAGGASDSST